MDEEQLQAIIRIVWITTLATAVVLAGWLVYEKIAERRRLIAPADDPLAEEPKSEPTPVDDPTPGEATA